MTDALVEGTEKAEKAVTNRVAVRVFANELDDEVVFTHDWSANGGQYKDPPMVLPPGRRDWTITYTLHDFTNCGLQFVGDAEDAMWVQKGLGCPAGPGNGDDHIDFGSVSSQSLTVVDDNYGDPCTLTYMLRFKDNSSNPRIYRYDPEIKNGGTN